MASVRNENSVSLLLLFIVAFVLYNRAHTFNVGSDSIKLYQVSCFCWIRTHVDFFWVFFLCVVNRPFVCFMLHLSSWYNFPFLNALNKTHFKNVSKFILCSSLTRLPTDSKRHDFLLIFIFLWLSIVSQLIVIQMGTLKGTHSLFGTEMTDR